MDARSEGQIFPMSPARASEAKPEVWFLKSLGFLNQESAVKFVIVSGERFFTEGRSDVEAD